MEIGDLDQRRIYVSLRACDTKGRYANPLGEVAGPSHLRILSTNENVGPKAGPTGRPNRNQCKSELHFDIEPIEVDAVLAQHPFLLLGIQIADLTGDKCA